MKFAENQQKSASVLACLMIRMAAKAQPVAWSCSITMFDALKFA